MPLVTEKEGRSWWSGALQGFAFIPCLAVMAFQLYYFVTPTCHQARTLPLYVSMAVILLFILFDRKINYGPRLLIGLTVTACVLLPCGCLCLLYDALPLHYTAQILAGIGRGIAIILLGIYLCRIKPHHAFLTLTCGFALYALLILLNDVFPMTENIMLCFLCTVIFAFSLYRGFDAPSFKASFEEKPVREPSGKSSVLGLQTYVVALVVLVILNLALEICFSGTGEKGPGNGVWAVTQVLFFILTVGYLVVAKQENVELLIPLYLLPMLLAPLFAVIFMHYIQPFTTALILGLRRANFLVVWATAILAVRQSGKSPVLVFGLFYLLLLQLPRVLSGALSPLMIGVGSQTVELAADIMVFAGILILAIAIFYNYVIRKKKAANNTASEESAEEKPARHPGNTIAAFCRKYNLSERETEITRYLARGYTFPEIGKRLFISSETVRSHAKNIYIKVGVANKQELLNVLEAFSDSEKNSR